MGYEELKQRCGWPCRYLRLLHTVRLALADWCPGSLPAQRPSFTHPSSLAWLVYNTASVALFAPRGGVVCGFVLIGLAEPSWWLLIPQPASFRGCRPLIFSTSCSASRRVQSFSTTAVPMALLPSLRPSFCWRRYRGNGVASPACFSRCLHECRSSHVCTSTHRWPSGQPTRRCRIQAARTLLCPGASPSPLP